MGIKDNRIQSSLNVWQVSVCTITNHNVALFESIYCNLYIHFNIKALLLLYYFGSLVGSHK